jgi:hypothetical protein
MKTTGGSTAGVGIEERRRALGALLEASQQLAVRVAVFDGQIFEQQSPDTA